MKKCYSILAVLVVLSGFLTGIAAPVREVEIPDRTCPVCKGSGRITEDCPCCENGRRADGTECVACGGKGKVEALCRNCGGSGRLDTEAPGTRL